MKATQQQRFRKKNCQKDFPLEIIIIIILFVATPANLLKSHGRKRAAKQRKMYTFIKQEAQHQQQNIMFMRNYDAWLPDVWLLYYQGEYYRC